MNPGPSTYPFTAAPDIVFVAHSPEYGLEIQADFFGTQSGDRMVFVDEVEVHVTRILCVEDLPFIQSP